MSPKKKLTYILHDISVGGVEVALVSAIPALHKTFDLSVIVLGSVNAKLVAGLSEEEKKVFKTFDYPLYLYPVVLPGIVSAVIKTRPDLLISSLWRGCLVGVLCRMFGPKVRFFAFNHSTRYPHVLAKTTITKANELADVVLCDSEATRIFVSNQIKTRGDIRVVSFLARATPPDNNMHPPTPGGDVRFMFLGRINEVKNLPASIRLIAALRKHGIPATMDIYGPDDDASAEEVRNLVNREGLETSIIFKGELGIQHKSDTFRRYHFYLQTSHFEGMAMSVVEAMQHGLVCMVSPVGDIVNYSKDMESAVFLRVADESKWEEDLQKVLRVISDPGLYRAISEKCHENFLRREVYSDSLIRQLNS